MRLVLDNNVIFLAFVFLLDGFVNRSAFTAVLYITLMVLAAFNVAPVRMPKFGGRWFYVLTGYVLGLTVICARILWIRFQ